MTNPIKVTPRSARRYVQAILNAGLVPYISGSPGIGKSTIVASIASDAELKLMDYRASTGAPEDLNGLPDRQGDHAVFLPFTDNFPVDTTPLPEGYKGWLLFLDELSNAQKYMQGGLYKLILDRMVGARKLHDSVVIVAAGNSVSDRAAANIIGTALRSRMVHLHMVEDYNEWLEDVAIPGNYSAEVMAYLAANKHKLMDFDPSRDDDTFACPRTWSMLDNLIQYGNGDPADPVPVTHADQALFAGAVGAATALEFVTFCEVFKDIPQISDVIKNPLGAILPVDKAALLWATASMLQREFGNHYADHAAILAYVQRMPASYLVLFGRAVRQRFPQIDGEPAWTTFKGHLSAALVAP